MLLMNSRFCQLSSLWQIFHFSMFLFGIGCTHVYEEEGQTNQLCVRVSVCVRERESSVGRKMNEQNNTLCF